MRTREKSGIVTIGGLQHLVLATLALAAIVPASGCRPRDAEGGSPGAPAPVAVFEWARPSQSFIAANSTGAFRYSTGLAEVNDKAGVILAMHGEYDPGLVQLVWSITFGGQPDGHTFHRTEAFWLVLTSGPMPLGSAGETAQYIFDASGPEPALSAYTYNGRGDASSISDGSGEPGLQAPDPIFTSLDDPEGVVLELFVEDHPDGTTTMGFTIDASVVNDHVPLHPAGMVWQGAGFADHVGVWMHPVTNVSTEYDDGYLTRFSHARNGWWDGADIPTAGPGACCLPDGTCEPSGLSRCATLGGTFLGVGSDCDVHGCPSPPGTDCCEDGKLAALVLQYTGESCDATLHGQKPDKVRCDGDPALAPLVRIIATDKEDPGDPKATVWFDGDVELDGFCTIEPGGATKASGKGKGKGKGKKSKGKGKFKSSIHIHVLDPDGTPLQSVEFHTSCSQALAVGDRFGSLTLIDCMPGDPPDGGAEASCCESGEKPQVLVLEYNGEGCDASRHDQPAGKSSCTGDAELEPEVHILATDSDDPDDSGARVWFDGTVPLGTEFDIDATRAGETRFKSNTYLHVFAPDGSLLQTIQFHTSCSAPLALGDQHGSVVIVDCLVESDRVGGGVEQACCESGKPHTLIMKYTGEGCAASRHGQDTSKSGCDGDPALEPAVRVLATDSDDPDDTGGNVWFDDLVALEGLFDVDAGRAGRTKLQSNTYVHVFDLDGNWLQTIQFHSSCSQPLAIDDQFGSIVLLECLAD